ncbi:MAG: Gx transporter family protein [Treponema sp.]|nr:Gx transporter family protein [Treponema sp.]
MRNADSECVTSDTAFFAALCLFLSAVEYAIPKPLPFLRLGLANMPILLAIKKMPVQKVLVLVGLKILGQACISGTLFSYIFLFSAAGNLASGLVMMVLCRLFYARGFISTVGLSLAGAFANSKAQLICSNAVLFRENTKYIAPLLLCSGFLTGLILGLFVARFEKMSRWFAQLQPEPKPWQIPQKNESGAKDKNVAKRENIIFVCCMVLMMFFLFVKNNAVLWSCVALFFAAVMFKKKGRIKLFPALCIVLSVTFFALLSPFGKVLATLGPWRITQGALAQGLHRSGILVGMVFLSQLAIGSQIRLPGIVGDFVAQEFSILKKMMEHGISFASFRSKGIVVTIDEWLLRLSGTGQES